MTLGVCDLRLRLLWSSVGQGKATGYNKWHVQFIGYILQHDLLREIQGAIILKSSFQQLPNYGRDEHMFRNHFATVLILLINCIQNILDNTNLENSKTGSMTQQDDSEIVTKMAHLLFTFEVGHFSFLSSLYGN